MRTPYIVQLNKDIQNPDKDGRSKDWNKQPVIKADSRFMVRGDTIRISKNGGFGGYAFERVASPLGRAILANSSYVPPVTVQEFLCINEIEWGGDEILRMLMKLGRVKPEDFKAVAEAAAADENF